MVFLHWIFYLHKGEPDQDFSPCVKTESSFNLFWIANAGIEPETPMGYSWGWGKIMKHFELCYFVKQHLCDSMYISISMYSISEEVFYIC